MCKPHANHKEKPIVHTQKIRRKESKHTTKENSSNHKGREQGNKKGPEELSNRQKIIHKMAICIYLLIITLNINRLNYLIKRQSD